MSDKQGTDAFRAILNREIPGIDVAVCDSVVRYRDLVLAGNKTQNLTRILEPGDFFSRNCGDVLALRDSGFYGETNVDHGSGSGVPGILAAIFGLGKWMLTESEGRKAEFLRETVQKLALAGRVEVFEGRTERFLKGTTKSWTVVSSGVGKATKVFETIEKCSTWNNLVLYKGKGWTAEAVQLETLKKRVAPSNVYDYRTIVDGVVAEFKLINLRRVPRGTTN